MKQTPDAAGDSHYRPVGEKIRRSGVPLSRGTFERHV